MDLSQSMRGHTDGHNLYSDCRLSFVVLQDLLVDCFKPTEVRFFLLSFYPLDTLSPTSMHSCVLSLLSPRRTLSQSCSTRSEGCRSSPRLRRNDGVPPLPTSSPPPRPSPLVFLPRFLSFVILIHLSFIIPLLSLPGSSPINRFHVSFFL